MLIYTYVCIIFICYLCYNFMCPVFCYILSLLFTEFRSNGNWEYSVPVHPGLLLHKSQPDYHHVGKQHLHTTGRLNQVL